MTCRISTNPVFSAAAAHDPIRTSIRITSPVINKPYLFISHSPFEYLRIYCLSDANGPDAYLTAFPYMNIPIVNSHRLADSPSFRSRTYPHSRRRGPIGEYHRTPTPAVFLISPK